MSEPAEPSILLDHLEDGISRITLNRPAKRNALDRGARAALLAALEACRGRSKVVIITGAGATFCAGMDLNQLASDDATDSADGNNTVVESGADELNRTWLQVLETIARHPAIVIASAAGYALGGGATLINTADLAVVADDAQIGLPEAGFGYYSGVGGPVMQLRLGAKRAAWMVLTAKRISGTTAEEWGLANLAVPASELPEATLELARHVAQFDATTLEWSKKALWHVPTHLRELTPAIEFGSYVNAQMHARNAGHREPMRRFIDGTPNPGQGVERPDNP